MPPKPAESAASSALPPALDDLEAELKLKHSRKGVADDATTADASAARGVAGHDDGSSAVAQALAASGIILCGECKGVGKVTQELALGEWGAKGMTRVMQQCCESCGGRGVTVTAKR